VNAIATRNPARIVKTTLSHFNGFVFVMFMGSEEDVEKAASYLLVCRYIRPVQELC
jgi:hypothetical protein